MTVYPQIRTSADFLNSTIRLNELIPFLQSQEAKSCAIVNSKLYGVLPFYSQLKAAGIHPVIGLKVNVRFSETAILPLVLYAENNVGYGNLLKITSGTSLRDDETLPLKWLIGYSKGLISSIPVLEGDWLKNENRSYIQSLRDVFPNHLYMGISRQGGEISVFEDVAIELSNELQIPIMATHESLYLNKDDQFAYDVARCIDLGTKLHEYKDFGKMKDYHVPTASEWRGWFYNHPEWLQQSEYVLDRCHVNIQYEGHFMPKYPLKPGLDVKEVLKALAFKGLKERLQTENPSEVYINRLRYELNVIISMGYEDYFLIVADIMNFARTNRILTGPGRGSSASSLVAYSLYITQVDPIEYGLLFERFLNPERVSLPDIDMDFVDTRRHEIIEYVVNKFGQKNVAQIITYGTLTAKAVARDVARMFNFDSKTLEFISKLIPRIDDITLQKAYEISDSFRNWVDQEEIRKQWFSAAKKLEGLPRNASTHAAGVVICPFPLVEVVPVQKGHDDILLTQWPMETVEKIGLLKMDFLGIRNLTYIEKMLQSIRYIERIDLDLNRIPLDDPKTFELLQRGDTNGIFQLESEGMKQALREVAPTEFLDIVAVNALHRPGPKEFIPNYARRKKGLEKVVYPHPLLEPILKETFGIIVYQEQIMQIANVIANFTFGEADILRRAVSKKNREVLESQRVLFVNRAVQNGIEEKNANDIYELIVRFADYGFPKGHSVAYSFVSYPMAYIKANYPLHFYAVLLTNAIGNTDRMYQLILEARSKGIEILPPSINKSKRVFTVENGKIRYSLSAIKGLSKVFLKKVMDVQKEGPFIDLFEFGLALSGDHFTRKNIEPLIKAGALDDCKVNRGILLASINGAISHVMIYRPHEEKDLLSDFPTSHGKYEDDPKNIIPEKLKLQYEQEVLGFYLSEHPVSMERKKLKFPTAHIGQILIMHSGAKVKMLGLVENIHQIRTKKGELMAFVQLQDEFGSISVTLFPKQYNLVMGWLKEEEMFLVDGIYEVRNGKPTIKANNITNNFIG